MSSAGPVALLAALLVIAPTSTEAAEVGGGPPRAAHGHLEGELSAMPVLGLGWLPAFALGVSPAIAFRWSDMSVSIEPRLFFSAHDTVVGQEATTTSLGLGVFSACRHVGGVFGCGVFGIGELRTAAPRGTQIDATEPWLITFGARGGADWRFSRYLGIRVYVEAHSLLGRPVVSVNNAEVWRAPWVAGVAGAGLVVPLGLY